MNKEDLNSIITELEAKGYVVSEKVSLWGWLNKKLSEQGTQRGLLLLVPLVLESVFQLDSPTSIQIVEGVIALYGTHNVVTPG
jgi:hypothetical protein